MDLTSQMEFKAFHKLQNANILDKFVGIETVQNCLTQAHQHMPLTRD